jgi:hypothetical protein
LTFDGNYLEDDEKLNETGIKDDKTLPLQMATKITVSLLDKKAYRLNTKTNVVETIRNWLIFMPNQDIIKSLKEMLVKKFNGFTHEGTTYPALDLDDLRFIYKGDIL